MRYSRILILTLVILFGSYNCLFAEVITDEAQQIFEQVQSSVFQIQVVDQASGKKSSIGSGFQFTPQGHIATNYHVVSDAIHRPKRYRVEYLRYDGVKGTLKILDVDVIHDIAIMLSDKPYDKSLGWGNDDLTKGTRLFSLGNPLDLGMTIAEGTFNGLMKKSLYKKILFSGSLNPGMSGGPTLNHEGKVIGVNVSTRGNQISFLVPVEYLIELQKKVLKKDYQQISDWSQYIEEQLLENQDKYMKDILSSNWETIRIGAAVVPGDILNSFKCWGDSIRKDKELYEYTYINCSTQDSIFLSDSFYTGQIEYKYNWMTSRGLNHIRFYKQYERFYSYPHEYYNAEEKDVTNFSCHTQFVEIDRKDFKASFCSRNYKKYSRLYDINLSLASVDEIDRGLLVEVVALGISKERAMDFVKKFMKGIQWPKLLLK